MKTKVCSACGTEKPLDEFYRRKSSRDGRRADCKDCVRQRSLAWKKENKERHLAANKAWQENNRKHYNESLRAWHRRNQPASGAIHKRYYEANKKKFNGWDKKRRAIMRGAPQKTAKTICRFSVHERDGGICHICGRPVEVSDFHLDHIIPVSRGGEHILSNVAVAHPFCNQSKGARINA